MTIRLLLVSALVAACGTSGGVPGEPDSCRLADVLVAERAGATPRDCGHLAVGAAMAEQTAAKNCVLAAVEAKESFEVVWDLQGTDSKVSRAILGLLGAEAAYSLQSFAYDGDPSGGGGERHPHTTIASCAGVRATAECTATDLASSLCLECTTPTPSDTCSTP